MGTPAVAMEVDQAPSGDTSRRDAKVVDEAAAHHVARSQRHDTFPRWFRMSAKLSVMVLLLSLPVLALRATGGDSKFALLFMLLGAVALPMWIPYVGQLVMLFTMAVPVCVAAIWLAYGLFVGLQHHLHSYLMISIIILSFILFFLGEIAGLPATLSGAFMALYSVCLAHFFMTPPIAKTMSLALTAALIVAAFLVTGLFSVVFPEYCLDAVWRGHHEGLEHLLHMAYHVLKSQPPRLLHRGMTSEARRYGSSATDRRALRALSEKDKGRSPAQPPVASVDQGDQELPATMTIAALPLDPDLSASDDDDNDGMNAAPGTQARLVARARWGRGTTTWRTPVSLTPMQKAERSYHRSLVAMGAGAKAEGPSKAELVLGHCGSWRFVIPWCPFLPSTQCRPNPEALVALRAEAMVVALGLYKFQAALQQLDPDTRPTLRDIEGNGASWHGVKSSLLGALQELVYAFPQDYYPPPRRVDTAHSESLMAQASQLKLVWNKYIEDNKGDGSDGSKGGLSPQLHLHATLMLQQLEDTAGEVARLTRAAQVAMDGLESAVYGCCLCRSATKVH